MGFIRNLLAVIGLVVVVAGGGIAFKASAMLSEFDPDFLSTYSDFAKRLLETKDPGVSMMYSVQVNEGITPDEVKESLQSLANQKDFLYTGEAPFYKQVEAITGEPYRYINFLSFCDAQVGKMMADYRDAYTGFMPCRIAVVEDQAGKLWMHTMNLDLMIYGGKPLPADLKAEALRVWQNIRDIMAGAAEGDF